MLQFFLKTKIYIKIYFLKSHLKRNQSMRYWSYTVEGAVASTEFNRKPSEGRYLLEGFYWVVVFAVSKYTVSLQSIINRMMSL